MIILRFKIPVEPKNRNELLNVITDISRKIKKEQGCIDNNIYQNLDDENEFIMFEAWKTRTFLKRHWRTLNFKALLDIQKFLRKPMGVEINNIIERKGKEEIEKVRNYDKLRLSENGIKVNAEP